MALLMIAIMVMRERCKLQGKSLSFGGSLGGSRKHVKTQQNPWLRVCACLRRACVQSQPPPVVDCMVKSRQTFKTYSIFPVFFPPPQRSPHSAEGVSEQWTLITSIILLILYYYNILYFSSELQDYTHYGCRAPRHTVVLCFGDEYPDQQRHRKMITAQVQHMVWASIAGKPNNKLYINSDTSEWKVKLE